MTTCEKRSNYQLSFYCSLQPIMLLLLQAVNLWCMDFDILTIAKNYLKAIKANKDLSLFFHPDVMQIELPNRLNPKGVISNAEQIAERFSKSRKLLKMQNYEIENDVVKDDLVVLQIKWTGVLAVSVGTLGAGQTMKGHFAMFFQFKNGQIIKQTNYNCFEDF